MSSLPPAPNRPDDERRFPVPSEPKMTRKWPWVVGVLAGLLLLGAIADAVGDPPPEPTSEVASSPSPSPTPVQGYDPNVVTSPEPSPPPEPTEPAIEKGKYSLASCDLNLFTNGVSRSTLIGSTELENNGTVPLKITVSFAWLFGDGSKLRADDKTVELQSGRTKLVFFKANVGTSEVDAFQSHPGYYDSDNCETKASF